MATAIKQKRKTIPAALELSAEDRNYLLEFNAQRAMLSAYTEAVAERAQNGLVVHGLPGIGKTKTIFDALDRIGVKPAPLNGWCTPRGLFDARHGISKSKAYDFSNGK